MKLRIAHLMLILAGFTALPATVLALPPTTPKPNPLAGPNKQVHDAQAALEVAKKQFLVIRRRVEVVFEARPDFKTTKVAMDKAKADYDAGNAKVVANLHKNPEYIALEAKRDKAQAVLDQESHPAPTPSGDDPVKLTVEQIDAASKDRTESGLAIRAMQKSAEDNDPTIVDLRQKMLDTRAAWDALQAQVDEAVKLDPGYSQAQTAVEQAEAQLKQARDAMAQAAQAARLADEQKMKSHTHTGKR